MRMLCRHVVLNFRPRRPLSTFNITSSSTLVTTATLPAGHVSAKAGAGEAAGVAGQAVASIQWFLSWFHIKKTRRLQQLVRLVVYVWFLKALRTCNHLIVWQVLKLLQETKPFSNTCVRDQSFLQLAIDTVYNYQERTRTELEGWRLRWSWLIETAIGLTHASTDFFHVMFAFTEFLPFSLKLFKSCPQLTDKLHQLGTRGINDSWNFAVLH